MAVIKGNCKNWTNAFSLREKAGMRSFISRLLPQGEGAVKATPLSLQALTTAAIILPGLIQPVSHAAEEDSADFQYSHYQEGKRDISGMILNPSTLTLNASKLLQNLNPIEVDSLHGSTRISITDRVKFAFNYTQDSWSGATPAGTAPVAAQKNVPQYASKDSNTGLGIGAITGASPYARDGSYLFMDKNLNLYSLIVDRATGALSPGLKNNQLTHVLAAASPETRKQGDFKLSYEWDEAAATVGGGISIENDYESRFVNLGGRMDFNRKQTTVNMGLSYTNSDTFATLDPDSIAFISTDSYEQLPSEVEGEGIGEEGGQSAPSQFHNIAGSPAQIDSTYDSLGKRTGAVLRGNRQDWGTQLSLTQVLNKDALLELGLGYTRSTGFLANPYKLVYRATATFLAGSPSNELASLTDISGVIEKRPDERNQFNWSLGYDQYIEPFDAALHFDYHFAHDDWGINAHTFETDWVQPLGAGWTVIPRVRYYSQDAAEFYTPFLKIVQVLDPSTGLTVASSLDRPQPDNFSSDQRLSGFGTLSGGVTIAKQFAKGIQLETGFEYYTHQGGLKIGGGGEQDFADYDYWVANAALKVNLGALGLGSSRHDGHSDHGDHHHSNSPAGIMFDHTLKQAGDMMVGYRYMHSEQAGDMLLGSQTVSPDTVRFNGCGDQECQISPNFMVMNMHMLDLMYAPTDWLTLMLMPQWMDMDMAMTPLNNDPKQGHNHGGDVHSHQTGGIGDTGVYALFKLFEQSGHHVNLSLGGTAPTGDVDITLRKTHTNKGTGIPIHFGMQLGSGTWDFKPSLTYTGESDRFSWGAQITGTKRLESHNKSGFAFGDIFQGSVWGGYQWTNWLSTTVRGVYTQQGKIRGGYPTLNQTFTDGSSISTPYPYSNHVGPFDFPANYGGQFVDLGLGVNVSIPSGTFAGNTLKFEWLQPIRTDYNGYQLERDGALAATWSYGF
ncbi:DUF3570 domain-containing protein [Methyloglobulus sp.]|uniref:DUF3570 domain-containing protein n=1 Tax=Methyloglobulus sp. TaxID=2518622 RepID=UPI0032B74D71